MTPDYIPFGICTFRSSTLPDTRFRRIVDQLAAEARPARTVLEKYVRELAGDPVLLEAVAVSSTSLAQALQGVAAGHQLSYRRLLKLAQSVTRYALRITGRATPFGLHAGVGRAKFERTAAFYTTGVARKGIRPDGEWLDDLVRRWRGDRQARDGLRVVANNLAQVRGDRLLLPYVRAQAGESPGGRQTKIKLTGVLRATLEAARTPIGYADLRARLQQMMPQSTEDAVDRYLSGLLEQEVLLDDLASRVEKTWTNHSTASTSPSSPLCDLKAVLALSDAYERKPVGGGLEAWTALTGGTHSPGQAQSNLHIDLCSDAHVTLPHSVLREVERYVNVLWAIAPAGRYAPLRAYRQAFLEKYGAFGAVRLGDLVDSARGLGFPISYRERNAAGQHWGHEGGAEAHRGRADALAALVHRGLTAPTREVHLTGTELDALRTEKDHPAFDTIEAFVQLLAKDVHAIDRGEYLLVPSPTAGTHLAGATTGRFTHHLGAHADDILRGIQDAHPQALPAQVTFLPAKRRVRNVMSTAIIAPAHIPVGIYAESDSTEALEWPELLIADDGKRLRCYLPDGSREVLPLMLSNVTLATHAPDVARLLTDLRFTDKHKSWGPWDWAEFRHLPVLPRVRMGRTVLSPLTWAISSELRRAAESTDAGTWHAALGEWREEFGVHERVMVRYRDLGYEINLDNRFQSEMLRRDVAARSQLIITESPHVLAGGDAFGWAQGRATELVMPFRAHVADSHAPATAPGRRWQRTAHRPRRLPGGSWAYVQIAVDAAIQNDLLVDRISPFLGDLGDQARRWHFVRYQVPDDHLRLRIQGHSDSVTETVWPRLLRALDSWQDDGLCSGFRILPYEPEVDRYGGSLEVMSFAEDLFHLDSRMAVEQLRPSRAAARSRLSRSVLCVANYALLLDALGEWDWRQWSHRALRLRNDGRLERHEIDLTHQIFTASSPVAFLEDAYGDGSFLDAWQSSSEGRRLGKAFGATGTGPADGSAAAYSLQSLLHMQHNRLFGIDTAAEESSLMLLSHVSRSLGRRPHVQVDRG